MNCPKCAAAMEKVSFEGIEIDRCTACRGLWFDAMEHEKLKKIEGSGAIDDGAPTPADAAEHHKLDCPHCKTPMIAMVVRGQPIKYESCTVCYGAFFDAGEFRQYRGEGLAARLKGLVGAS